MEQSVELMIDDKNMIVKLFVLYLIIFIMMNNFGLICLKQNVL